MKILLTNDDGIHAPGIEALYEALIDTSGDLGGPLGAEIVPVAPLTVQSAAGHGISFKTPLMTSRETVSPRMTGVAVDGRPADCVKLALSSLWPDRFGEGTRPDLVISGMNAGANVGINVIYSGTVAAALEAAFLGVPSIAVSQHMGRGTTDFARGAALARRTIDRVLEAWRTDPDSPFGAHACVNINVPICQPEPVEPATLDDPEVVVCPMNTHGLNDAYERRQSPHGKEYFWSAGGGLDFAGADPGTDVAHLFARRITVTPLRYDLTHHDHLGAWRRSLGV